MPRELWPHQEAERVLEAFPGADSLVLETGYGPSGSPHIGTFAEVARTTWLGEAIRDLSGKSSTLIAFSDDMDGLRKVPLNMPREALEPHLGKPVCLVPDPFACHPSYAAHNNMALKDMLDRFGFPYTFKSSHEQYTQGIFNEGMGRILSRYEAVREVILPTIRAEKRPTWSPLLPLCEACGRVNGTRVTGHDPKALTVTYVCEGSQGGALGDEAGPEDGTEAGPRPDVAGCGHRATVSVLDGRVKAGWKVDWALRWFTFGVHFEMFGKDLIESAALSAKICAILSGPGGGHGPVRSFYEMFLDEQGRKISKSVGRGLTVDSWLAYAPKESLLLFIFKEPRKAKKLTWEVVARSVDEYLQLLQRHYQEPRSEVAARDELGFIQPRLPETCPYAYPVSYSMLVGLIGALGAPPPQVVAGYVRHYKGAIPSSDPALEVLINYADGFVRDHVLGSRVERRPAESEAALVRALADFLEQGGERLEAEEIQHKAFDIARDGGMEPREYFRLLYNILTGQDFGPRLGSFLKLMEPANAAAALRRALR